MCVKESELVSKILERSESDILHSSPKSWCLPSIFFLSYFFSIDHLCSASLLREINNRVIIENILRFLKTTEGGCSFAFTRGNIFLFVNSELMSCIWDIASLQFAEC